MKRLTAMLLTLALVFSLLAVPVAQAATYATATVKGGWLRLRAEPSYWAETISAYYTGTNVTILGGSGQWYHVSTPDGKTGYMHSDYLTITGSITGGQLDENTQAYVTSKNGKSVRLRTGPSTSYSTIASYAVGTPVTILISGDDWCKVRINGRTGYMMTEFITTSGVTAPDAGVTVNVAYVTSKNGLSVNLRSGASKIYSAIASYPVGTQVTVLEWGKTWSRIRVNNTTGYMMTEFLTTSAPSVITSVVLSDSSVWPGDTIYATVVPSGASVTYEWLNDQGTRLGTGSSYKVQNSDSGRRIRVRVSGASGATGTAVSGWATVQGSSYVTPGYTLTGVTISDTTPTVGQTITATLKPAGATANISWFRDDGVFVGSGSTYLVRSTDEGRRLYAWAEGTGSTSGSATSSYTSAVAAATATKVTLRSVTISDTTPTVGQTLTAELSPSGATANITWYRANGSIAGYGNAYTVQQGDLGSSLYVYATGTGNTTGSAVSSVTGKVTGGTSSQSYRINKATLSDTTPSVGQTIYVTVDPAGATALITWYRDDDVILGYGASYTVTSADAGHEMYVWVEGYGDTTGSCTSAITAPVTGGVATSTDFGW
ncbi:MAG: SH3 domain-containing protein [Clostridia bacterium]|nr:SH3 domain-containing protein [Clostridia bacterium]